VSSVEPDLAARAVRGGAVTVLTQGLRAATQLAGLIVLSRLLPPEDVGILAMVFVVTNLGDVIRDFGLSIAAVQADRLTRDERDALFWLNTLLGVATTSLLVLGAPLAAQLLDEPRLTTVLRVVSVTLLFNSLGAQYQADLNRELRFAAIGWAEAGATFVALLAAIACAALGLGYWSLAIQQIVVSVVLCGSMAVMAGWLPGLPRRNEDVRGFVSYSTPLFGTQVLSYVTQNTDNFVIGRRFGATVLGPYARAFQILILPVNQLSNPLLRVTLPVLSRVRADDAKYEDYLLRGQSVLGYGIVGLLSFTAAVANPLFVLLLGKEWAGVATPFRILAIGGCFQSLSFVCYWVFLSKALTRTLLKHSILARAIALLLIIVGSHWGVNGVAAGVAAGLAASWPLAIWWLWRSGAISPSPVIRLGLRILVGGTLPALVSAVMSSHCHTNLPRLAAATIGWILGAGALILSSSYRADGRVLLHARTRLRGPDEPADR
jgi:PST family polysaccharide transporter